MGRISSLMNPLTYVVINLGIVALLYSGALSIQLGTLRQGDVIALVNYMNQVLVELVKLANLVVVLTRAWPPPTASPRCLTSRRRRIPVPLP